MNVPLQSWRGTHPRRRASKPPTAGVGFVYKDVARSSSLTVRVCNRPIRNKELSFFYREGMSLAFRCMSRQSAFSDKASFEIMVSIWWLIWAFVIGGYAGMLLISLLVLARRMRAPS